jgi:CRP-like cAMP-binding protein
MVASSDAIELQDELKHRGIKIRKTQSTVLFRRGEKASGIFIVLSGIVTLDFGGDASQMTNHSYGPGAVLGLPASLTKRCHSMTAIVTQDAELGFWPAPALDALLRKRPDLCRQLLQLLRAKISEMRPFAKGF